MAGDTARTVKDRMARSLKAGIAARPYLCYSPTGKGQADGLVAVAPNLMGNSYRSTEGDSNHG